MTLSRNHNDSFQELFSVLRAYFRSHLSSEEEPTFDDPEKLRALKTLKCAGLKVFNDFGKVFTDNIIAQPTKEFDDLPTDEQTRMLFRFLAEVYQDRRFNWGRLLSVCVALWSASKTNEQADQYALILAKFIDRHYAQDFRTLGGWKDFSDFFADSSIDDRWLRTVCIWTVVVAAGGLLSQLLYGRLF